MARVAYACSDVVLSVQPALGDDSEFSKSLQALASQQTPGIYTKEVEVLLAAEDAYYGCADFLSGPSIKA